MSITHARILWPVRRFRLHETERGGPGMFPHMRDVEGRKVVERTKLDVCIWGSRRAKVRGNFPHACI